MSELSFSQAQEDDMAQVRDILTDGTQHKLRLGDKIWGAEGWTEEEVKDRMAVSDTYVVYRDSEAVGTIALQWEDVTNWGEQPPNAAYVHRLVVKDEFRNQGISALMLDWAAQQAALQGREFLRLDCEAQNTALCRHYETLGFTQVASRPVPEYDDYIAALYERPIDSEYHEQS